MTAPLAGGNHYDKYHSRNPLERLVVSRFLASFAELVALSGARRVVEMGCGEGNLSLLMARRGLAVQGFDIDPAIVETARKTARAEKLEIPFGTGSIYDLKPGQFQDADLLVCCEVMEHLDEPALALDTLCRAGPRQILLSVPREPVWRMLNMARGKYWKDWGNTPGHVQHWSSGRFLNFLRRGQLEIVQVRRPLPWTMALCRVPD